MKRHIVIRMDDICETMDYEKFCKYEELFDKYKIKPLIGIVPLCMDDQLKTGSKIEFFYEKVHELVEKGWATSMHGCHHVYTSRSSGHLRMTNNSEFAGESYEHQLRLLKLGIEELKRHNIYTDTFMPPAHTYDKNTLLAMRACGLNYLSDGMSLSPYKLCGVHCIPADDAYRLNIIGLLTICVHSNYDDDDAFDKLERFISRNKEHIISFDRAKELNTVIYFVARIEELLRIYGRRLLVFLCGR